MARSKTGARFNMVPAMLWQQPDLLALDPPPISAATLYLYLRTCDRPTSIAGFVAAGAGSIADQVGWQAGKVRKCLDELHSAGVAVVSTRPPLVLIPAALHFQTPTGNNLIGALRELGQFARCNATEEAALIMGADPDQVWPAQRGTQRGGVRGAQPGGVLIERERDKEREVYEATPLGLDAGKAQHPDPSHPLSVYVVEVWSDRKLGKLATLDAWASRQQDACPGLDLVAEAKRAAAWEDSNPGKRKRDIRRFLGSWFSRQQDRGAGGAQSNAKKSNRPPWERTIEDVKAEVEANLRAKGIDPDALTH